MGAICQCGCGLVAPIAKETDPRRGRVKGQPMRFRQGHGKRKDFDSQYVVTDAGYATDCWLWAGAKRGNPNNLYGTYTRFDGRRVGAHVFAVERSGRAVPGDMEVDHLCGNRLCVNPDHLEVVTHLENVRRGKRAKLTIEAARAIRNSPDGCHVLARSYGVAPSTIKRIRKGALWAEA